MDLVTPAALLRASPLPSLEARILLTHVLGWRHTQLITRSDEALDGPVIERYRALEARRVAGEPVAQLVGAREFFGLDFDVTPDVLIPRPETELLVETALAAMENILRPRERGFLASVLAPDSRAVSINVDAASGVSGLIWPGDYVDVVLTQEPTTGAEDKTGQQHGVLSETVVQNVRVVAIDQEIVQGGPANNATAGKVARTVTLQLVPEQVKKVTVAGQRGKLTLAVRSAVDGQDTGDTDATVVVYARNNGTKYSVKKDDTGNTRALLSGDVSPEIVPSAPVASAVPSRR